MDVGWGLRADAGFGFSLDSNSHVDPESVFFSSRASVSSSVKCRELDRTVAKTLPAGTFSEPGSCFLDLDIISLSHEVSVK